MSDCDRIQSAMKQLPNPVLPEDFEPLAHILDEVNGPSHILNSNLHRDSFKIAKELDAKGRYTEAVDPKIAGATARIQQDHGKPNYIELVEGNRTESVRLDQDTSVPMLDLVDRTCSGLLYQTDTVLFDGKPVAKTIRLPNGLDIYFNAAGKAQSITPR